MTTIDAHQAAGAIISLLNTPVLADADAAFYDNPSGTVGDWLELARRKYDRLSTGEQILLRLVRTVWNGGGDVKVMEIRDLDTKCQAEVLNTLRQLWVGA